MCVHQQAAARAGSRVSSSLCKVAAARGWGGVGLGARPSPVWQPAAPANRGPLRTAAHSQNCAAATYRSTAPSCAAPAFRCCTWLHARMSTRCTTSSCSANASRSTTPARPGRHQHARRRHHKPALGLLWCADVCVYVCGGGSGGKRAWACRAQRATRAPCLARPLPGCRQATTAMRCACSPPSLLHN